MKQIVEVQQQQVCCGPALAAILTGDPSCLLLGSKVQVGVGEVWGAAGLEVGPSWTPVGWAACKTGCPDASQHAYIPVTNWHVSKCIYQTHGFEAGWWSEQQVDLGECVQA